jgi:hypothetical protein
MTFPITPPTSAFPINAAWGVNATFANQNNVNSIANYAWGGIDSAPTVARVATTGAETYTIVSGSVTVLNGLTVDSVTLAVNDVVLVMHSPASSGAGTLGVLTTQPPNGLYYVTSLAGGNIAVSRCATMSALNAQPNPGGRVVFTRFEGVINGSTFWQVTTPASDATFTYGTTSMAWENFFLAGQGIPNAALQQAGINNFNSAVQSTSATAATKFYITNSNLKMPAVPITGMTANRTTFIWDITMTKTGVGTGTFQIVIFRGTNGTSADSADAVISTGTAQTAVADTMQFNVQLTVTTVGATGAYFYVVSFNSHTAASGTGFGITTTPAISTATISSVAMNTASLQFGLGFVSNVGAPTLPFRSVKHSPTI